MKKIKLQETDYKVLQLLMKNDYLYRNDISKFANISPAGITKIVSKLSKTNLIKIEKLKENDKRTIIRLNETYKYILGLNFGAGFMTLAVSDLKGNILDYKNKKIPYKNGLQMLKLMVEEIKDFMNKHNEKYFIAIGLSINGIVNTEKGISIFSPHIRWENFNIKEYLEKSLKLKVILDNDVRAMLKAEMILAKRERENKNAILLYIKDGIGSAFWLDSHIYMGSRYAAGEIGHFIVDNKSNILCKCGNYGCLESEYSDAIMIEKINWELKKMGKDEKKLTMKDIYMYANQRREPFYNMIMKYAFDLGKVIANVFKIIDVEVVIISGEIMYSGKSFVRFLKKGMDSITVDKFGNSINIEVSRLGDKLEIYGSITLVLDNLFKNKKIINI